MGLGENRPEQLEDARLYPGMGLGQEKPPPLGNWLSYGSVGHAGEISYPLLRLTDQQNSLDFHGHPMRERAHTDRRPRMSTLVPEHAYQKIRAAIDDFRVKTEVRPCIYIVLFIGMTEDGH